MIMREMLVTAGYIWVTGSRVPQLDYKYSTATMSCEDRDFPRKTAVDVIHDSWTGSN